MTCPEVRRWLSPYLDGELDLATDDQVRTHLRECADCQAQYESALALRGSVRAVPSFEPSAEFRDKMLNRFSTDSQAAPAKSVNRFSTLWGFVAGVAVCTLAFVLFFGARPSLRGELVASHMRAQLANHMLDVPSSDRHTVKPWFSGRVQTAATPWDLKPDFPLLGGRLDLVDGQPVEVFVYGHGAHTIDLFVLPSSAKLGDSSIRGFHVRTWVQDGLIYAAVSDVDEPQLVRFEELYQAQKP